jgi:ribosomal protein S18 acetylase RimI-like enzyme
VGHRRSGGIRAASVTEPPGEVTIRRAVPEDAEAVAGVYLAAFGSTYDFPLAHTDQEVRGWIANQLMPRHETWVASGGDRVVAMMVLDDTGIDQLYVEPAWQGRGIGSSLLELAKERRPAGLELYTFQVNERARRFYEHHGFVISMLGDGSGNEERQPDVLYRWRP